MPDRVFAFVTKRWCVPGDEPNLKTRLSFDLGIEGDDARELFDEFKREFDVDISELHLYWNSYFAPEGVSFGMAIMFGAPIILLAIILSELFPRWPAWFDLLIGVVMSFAGLFGWAALMRRPGQNEITVGALIQAAQTGQFRVKPALKQNIAALSAR